MFIFMMKEEIFKEVARAFATEELFVGRCVPVWLRPGTAEKAINAVAETYTGDETPEALGLDADNILVHLYAGCDWLDFRDITSLSPKAKMSDIADYYCREYIRQTLKDARLKAIR